MRSLAAHLHDVDSHDRLPFHPSCPICRQTRLTGTDHRRRRWCRYALRHCWPPVCWPCRPRRRQPALLRPSRTSSRMARQPVTQNDADPDPDFDPGGETTDLPDAAPASWTAGPTISRATVTTRPRLWSSRPRADPDDPVVDSGDGTDRATSQVVTPASSRIGPHDGEQQPAGGTRDLELRARSLRRQSSLRLPRPPPRPRPRRRRRVSLARSAPRSRPRSPRRAARATGSGKPHQPGRCSDRTAPAAPPAAPASSDVTRCAGISGVADRAAREAR